MSDTTPKWAIPYVLGTDIGNTIDDTNKTTAERLDVLLTPFDQGALSARPVSTPASPGKTGRFYRATDTGQLFLDYGTGWKPVGADIVNADIAAGAAIAEAKLALATDAAAGTGSRRTLGTGATQAAPGNDSRINGAVQGAENLRTLRGTVLADGTIWAGSGFTVTKGAAGVYTINFTTAFAGVPSVQVTAASAAAMMVSGWGSAAGTGAVRTFDPGTGTAFLANGDFGFTATGPR